MRPNRVKRLLKDGKPAVGSWLNIPSITTAEIMAHVGWDWLVVELEHAPTDTETLQSMFIAISTTDTVPLCRVPDNDPALIKRALDAGAYGVVVPMVNTPEEAERAVKACKYPPEGIRSAGPGRWRFYGGDDYTRYANDEILVIVQIEHIDAVRRLDEILSVPGIDVAHIGPGDLAWSMGLGKGLGEKDPAHAEAVAEILRIAKKHGVPAGTGARTIQDAPKWLEQGFQFLSVMNDINFMYNSATEGLKFIRESSKI